MKFKDKFSHIFAYVALTSGSIWLGGYIARLLVVYSMFEETELTLKNFVNDSNLPVIFRVMSPLVNLTSISYLVLIVSFTLFLVFTPLKLKENGWLFITAAIIYITLPFETILLLIDFRMIILFLNEQIISEKILELIIERVTKLSSFPIIHILSYLTIPYLLIYKPFTPKIKDEN